MNKPIAPSANTSFTRPDVVSGSLSASAAAALLAAAGDVTFILAANGTILDVASQGDLAKQGGFADTIGRAWADTMTVESQPKVTEMLTVDRDRNGGPARWRQVNHITTGSDVPVRYLVMPLGNGDRLVAIGRDMRSAAVMQQRLLQTQQALERDYIRLRQAEARYRLLFDMTGEAMLIVDAASRRIREANAAAHHLLGERDGALIGDAIAGIVDRKDRDDLVAFLGGAETNDDMTPAALRLRDECGEVTLTARLFRQARAPMLIVRLTPASPLTVVPPTDAALGDVIEAMPDAFVLADRSLRILAANTAFVELTASASADRVIGAPLGTWLGRPGIDLELIVGQLRDHKVVRNVATIVNAASGGEEEVEVSGVLVPRGDSECYGFVVRHVARRLRSTPVPAGDLPHSVEQLTGLVGRMSLKDIVRESTDMIERLCIEAALAYTEDNRASAAEILGLSRQSLYSKLHRHGLGNLAPGEE